MCVDQKNHFGKKYDIKQIYDKNMTVFVGWGGAKKQYGKAGMRNMQCARHISAFIVSDENFSNETFSLLSLLVFQEF